MRSQAPTFPPRSTGRWTRGSWITGAACSCSCTTGLLVFVGVLLFPLVRLVRTHLLSLGAPTAVARDPDAVGGEGARAAHAGLDDPPPLAVARRGKLGGTDGYRLPPLASATLSVSSSGRWDRDGGPAASASAR